MGTNAAMGEELSELGCLRVFGGHKMEGSGRVVMVRRDECVG